VAARRQAASPGAILGLELAFPGHPWVLDIKHQTPWGEKKYMLKMFYLYKKMRKIPCRFFRICFIALLDVPLHGGFKNAKNKFVEKNTKGLKT
jgi:hypothetical protein